MRVAIVRLTAMGDIVHTLAALQFVKKSLPHIDITWFVEKKFAEVLKNNPHVDRIVEVDLHSLKDSFSINRVKEIAKKVKEAGEFDLVIDVQGLIKSAILARVAGKNVAGLDRESAKEGVATLLYKSRYRVECSEIAPFRFASLISQALGIEISKSMLMEKEPYLFYDYDDECKKIESFFSDSSKNIIFITAASNESKTYPSDKFAALAKELEDYNVLLIAGSQKERKEAEKIADASTAALLPSMSINALKFAISKCDLLVGADTGPSHMAWAMNRPSVLLFGSTPKSMMMESDINIAITSGAKVNPCRFDKSDRSIATIEPKMVADAVKEVLG